MNKKKKSALKSSMKASGIAKLAPAFTFNTFNKLREQGKGPPFVLRDGEAHYEWKDYRLWFKNTVIPLCHGEKVDVFTGKLIAKVVKVVEPRKGFSPLMEAQPETPADEMVYSAYLTGTLQKNAGLTTHQAAIIMHISHKAVENMRTHGTGPKGFKASNRILYKFGAIQAYMDGLTSAADAIEMTPSYGPANGEDTDDLSMPVSAYNGG